MISLQALEKVFVRAATENAQLARPALKDWEAGILAVYDYGWADGNERTKVNAHIQWPRGKHE